MNDKMRVNSWRPYLIPFLLVFLGGVFVWVALSSNTAVPPTDIPPTAVAAVPTPTQTATATATTTTTPSPSPTHTPEPIVPTRTPTRRATATIRATSTARATNTAVPANTTILTATTTIPLAEVTASPTLTPTMTATAVLTTTAIPPTPASTITPTLVAATSATPEPQAPPEQNTAVIGAIPNWQRFGVAVPQGRLAEAEAAGLRYGSFLNWWPNAGSGPNYWPMIRVNQQGIRQTTWDELDAVIAQRPGSYWLVGNEMDVKWQDNVTPERYAEIYHEVYTFIKARDASARVAIGGVSQPTPLRRAYLDRVLNHYQSTYGAKMPIDVWNVHAFILREEAGSWGVDVPPGMSGAGGMLYELDDHTNIEIFKQNLRDFRQWMAERGYGDKPLVISEYGVLMPVDYGFGVDVVADFLRQTLDFMSTAVGSTGYAPDGNRLVQWWFWYGVWENETRYPAGNLYDANTNQLTPAGRVFTDYPR